MPSGKTKFNPSWMEKLDNSGKTLGSWCKRDTGNEFAGYCTVSIKSISCSNSGANQLISHADGQKHKENMKYMHDNSQKHLFGSAPKPSSLYGGGDKSICMQVHPSHKGQVQKAEILWALMVASNTSSPSIDKKFITKILTMNAFFEQIANMYRFNLSDNIYQTGDINRRTFSPDLNQSQKLPGSIHYFKQALDQAKVLNKVNISGALGFSIIGLGIFLTIADKRIREMPQMRHLFQIMLFSIVTGGILHPLVYFGTVLHDNNLCEFVTYSAEYMSFASPLLMVVFHVEVLFTKAIPLVRWQTRELLRFCILSLISWLCTSLLVAHLFIAFNTKEIFCMDIQSAAIGNIVFALREVLPMALCALCNMMMIAVSCLKKLKGTLQTESSGPHPVRFADANDVSEWMRICLALNAILILRVVILAIALKKTTITPDEYIKVMVLLRVFRSQLFYFMPFCTLFISAVRRSMADVFLKIVDVFCATKEYNAVDISFGNISEDV